MALSFNGSREKAEKAQVRGGRWERNTELLPGLLEGVHKCYVRPYVCIVNV